MGSNLDKNKQPIENVFFSAEEKLVTNLIFRLGDVLYVLMQDTLKEMNKKGIDLKHLTKYRFRVMYKSLAMARDACNRFSSDVGQLNPDQVDQFFTDSDQLRELILMITHKVTGNDNNYKALVKFLESLPESKTNKLKNT